MITEAGAGGAVGVSVPAALDEPLTEGTDCDTTSTLLSPPSSDATNSLNVALEASSSSNVPIASIRPSWNGAAQSHHGLGRVQVLYLQQYDAIRPTQVLKLVRDEDPGSTLKGAADALVEDRLANISVKGAERVIEQVDVGVGIDGPCEADSLSLPSAKVHASFAEFGLMPGR